MGVVMVVAVSECPGHPNVACECNFDLKNRVWIFMHDPILLFEALEKLVAIESLHVLTTCTNIKFS